MAIKLKVSIYAKKSTYAPAFLSNTSMLICKTMVVNPKLSVYANESTYAPVCYVCMHNFT